MLPENTRAFRSETGFTLVELLITVAVIGVISAIAIPSLLDALDRSKQSDTMGTIRNLSLAIEAYNADYSRLPATGLTPDQLAAALATGGMFDHVDAHDGWGFPLVYTSDGDHYTVEAYCKDGADGPANITPATRHDYVNDIILKDGQFTASPES